MKKLIYIVLAFSTVAFVSSCEKQDSTTSAASADKSTGSGTGQGGSLARFTIAQDYLYVVDSRKLHAYSLTNSASPKLSSTQNIGEDIETIYAYKDKLFIGSMNAMYIYSIADPAHPAKLGTASHVRACDPVIADDNVAYVTVRSGNVCGGTQNAMFIYDVSNVLSPKQKNVIIMDNPWGLGKHNNTLFVCNGNSGLSVYDITNRYYPKLKQKLFDDTYYDVIVYNDMLICMVEGGTLLYELKADGQILKLAKING